MSDPVQIQVPPVLASAIDQLVEDQARWFECEPETVRRPVELAILRRGIESLQRERAEERELAEPSGRVA